MSLKRSYLEEIPVETQEVARAAFPKGNVYMRIRDELGMVYHDDLFGDLYSGTGQPGIAAWRLALVTVMQFCEGLTDREAAEAVRGRIDWKYALGLELRDPGFDFSVLSEFRNRLVAGGAESRLLEALLDQCKARGWVKARGRQRTDSTYILGAIHRLHRLELVAQTLQHTLNELAKAAPAWLKSHVPDEWIARYGRKLEESRFPKSEAERTQLATVIGRDGQQLLAWLDDPEAPNQVLELASIRTLRQVWEQQYCCETNDLLRWCDKEALPPATQRVASPHDLEARYSSKNGLEWVGYKVHLTECCDEQLPHLITHVETTIAPEQDIEAIPAIHKTLAKRDLLPRHHLVDSGYVSADSLLTSQRSYQIDLIGPTRPDVSWQAQQAEAFDISHFQIDWAARQIICPTGKVSSIWKSQKSIRDNPVIEVQFRKSDCTPCPMRALCTRSKTAPRSLTILPQALFETLQAARARQQTQTFKDLYAQRAGIEGTLSQTVNPLGMRRSRYLGLAKTRLQHFATAVAVNFLRLFAWLADRPLAETRISPFAALVS